MKLQRYDLIVQRHKKSTNTERYEILIRVGNYKSENRELVLRRKLCNIDEAVEADTSDQYMPDSSKDSVSVLWCGKHTDAYNLLNSSCLLCVLANKCLLYTFPLNRSCLQTLCTGKMLKQRAQGRRVPVIKSPFLCWSFPYYALSLSFKISSQLSLSYNSFSPSSIFHCFFKVISTRLIPSIHHH